MSQLLVNGDDVFCIEYSARRGWRIGGIKSGTVRGACGTRVYSSVDIEATGKTFEQAMQAYMRKYQKARVR